MPKLDNGFMYQINMKVRKTNFFFAIYVISYFMQGTDISNLVSVKKKIFLKLKFWRKINFPNLTQIEKQLFHMFYIEHMIFIKPQIIYRWIAVESQSKYLVLNCMNDKIWAGSVNNIWLINPKGFYLGTYLIT